MAEQNSSQEPAEEKMNPNEPTVYDVWKRADGLFPAEDKAKWISFVSSRGNLDGFVRVVGGEEGFTDDKVRKFFIPPGHSCEVLGCKILFTRA